MIDVLITGGGGQLGRELARAAWASSIKVAVLSRSGLDITVAADVNKAVAELAPSVIVNAAAYTAVDRAEDDEAAALDVNGNAVRHLTTAADRVGAFLIQISTDYVFDGTKADWYVEADPIAPLGAYGRSKATGEAAALGGHGAVVLRTSWVYSASGPNFVATMLRLARQREELGVVDDQIGCPTSAADLAQAIVALTEATDLGRKAPPHRLYHVASPEEATWHQLAMAAFSASTSGFSGTCRPLTTDQYPTRAARPANSRLSSALLADELGITLPGWSSSLPAVVAELEASGAV